MRRTILFALLPAILLAACSDGGAVYPVKVERARQILSKTGVAPIFGSNATGVDIQTYKPTEVTWIVSSNGSELMRYVATLSEAGEGRTRIGLTLKGYKGGPTGDVEKRFVDNPSIRNLYLVAMEERIASALQGRALDMSKVYPALGGAMVANMNNIRRSADEAAKASEELGRPSSSPFRRLGD
jgi:hypothetical protein